MADKFQIPGTYVSAVPWGSGHINDTFVATYELDGRHQRYVHQKLNTRVFPDPVALMDNLSRVVAHLSGQTPSLQLVPSLDGLPYYVHEGTQYWRTFHFIEGTRTLDVAETAEQVRQAAAAFGRFQLLLADLPGPRLHETIADFHDTRKRFEQFLAAAESDGVERARHCRSEIEFARERSGLASAITSQVDKGAFPERITHNDTKLNNVLLDVKTGKALCVIDLDTVMPGSVLYDFGDMVRTATMTVPEDEPDLARVKMDRKLFEAAVDGYLDSTGHWLNEAEKASLVLSARVITFEVGLRFLTDFLTGDNYFKTSYPDHNLVRARAQFALLRNLETESEYMEEVVSSTLMSCHPSEQ